MDGLLSTGPTPSSLNEEEQNYKLILCLSSLLQHNTDGLIRQQGLQVNKKLFNTV